MKTIQEREAELSVTHTHIIAGTMRDIDPDTESEFYNKRTVQIQCQTPNCKAKRRIATSDLHQVHNCEQCVRRERLARRRQARAERKAVKDAAKAAAKETTST